MINKFSKITLGLIAAASISLGGTNTSAGAQGIELGEVTQQSSQTIVRGYFFSSLPPYQYYYDDGVYRGYLYRVSYETVSGGYHAIYAGTVTSGNVPLPTKIIVLED